MIGPFFPSCSTCQCWNGDMCELISDFCDRGEMWEPSEEFITEHHEVAYLVAHRDALIERTGVRLRRLRISQLRRMAEACKSLFSRAIETSERRAPEFPPAERIIAINTRVRRFRAACLAEIERLRGMG